MPPAPRLLAAGEGRALLFGHGLLVVGAMALLVGASLVWLFVAGYGLTFSGLRPLAGSRGQAEAVVESSGEVALWTGERALCTTAIFSHQGQTYRALAFGPTTLDPGQRVRVIYPLSTPSAGWVEGLQRFPLRLRGLATLSLAALSPGLVLVLSGLLVGVRQRRTVVHGVVVQGRRTRHIGLARPLSEMFLDRFEWTDGGRSLSHWSVGVEGPETTPLLVHDAGAVVVERLLPGLEVHEGKLRGVSLGRKLCAWLVLAVGAGQMLALLLFLLT